jgi:hypothetical protein
MCIYVGQACLCLWKPRSAPTDTRLKVRRDTHWYFFLKIEYIFSVHSPFSCPQMLVAFGQTRRRVRGRLVCPNYLFAADISKKLTNALENVSPLHAMQRLQSKPPLPSLL